MRNEPMSPSAAPPLRWTGFAVALGLTCTGCSTPRVVRGNQLDVDYYASIAKRTSAERELDWNGEPPQATVERPAEASYLKPSSPSLCSPAPRLVIGSGA